MRTKNLVVSRLEVIHDINDHFRNFKRNFENVICVELPTPLKSCAAAEKYLEGGGRSQRRLWVLVKDGSTAAFL